jgi:hypothetical protein
MAGANKSNSAKAKKRKEQELAKDAKRRQTKSRTWQNRD